MKDRKKELQQQINKLEEQIKPLQDELSKLYQDEHDDVAKRVERVHQGKDKFTLDELRFAATSRCPCGAGLAYPKNIGMWGSWDCSDILLGRAIPKGKKNSKEHTGELPFTFYEIKSEDQPSAGGMTTRPDS